MANTFPDAIGIPQLDAHGFLLDPSNPASGLVGGTLSGLAVWSVTQTAAHLARPYGTWTDLTVSYSFGETATLPAGYEPFSSEAAKTGARLAMALYADVSGLTFQETTGAADITYMFGVGSGNGGGWANYPSTSGGYVQVGHVSWEADMTAGTYALNLLLHELGHGVGLAHPGDYNGNSAVYADADHFNDSAQYTNMSYWAETYTGAKISQLATLGLHDILAVQMEYGANWATRAGNTTYGFNATAGLDSYSFDHDADMGFSIWDGGGRDRLDFSGFSGNTVMDLRQGAFSSGGGTWNVSIAYGAVIEEALAGAGDDKIMGNDARNRLMGGAGADAIWGGVETSVAQMDARAFTGISLNEAALQHGQSLMRAGITAFSGAAFTFETLVSLTRVASSAVEFASYNKSGNDNLFTFEGVREGFLKVTLAGKAAYVTDYATENLIDGLQHRLSLAWEKATGALTLYVDGVQVHAGTYAAGATIASGGTLVIGQEQDALGGGFDPSQVLQGVVGDIRLFTDLRSGAEIAANAFTRLGAGTDALAHAWTDGVKDAVAGADMVSTGTVASVDHGTKALADADTLIGGLGNDTLTGGVGADLLIGQGAAPTGFAALTGVSLNETATDQYLAAAGYNGLGGTGPVVFTIDMAFRITHLPGSEVDLFSYANSQSSNALTLSAVNGGTVKLLYRGGTFDTGVQSSLLTDGQAHRLALTWDGRAGSAGFALYLDGAKVAQGLHAYQTYGLASGGTLIFGQEQDAVGGGFDANQILTGVVADIKVFNTIQAPGGDGAGLVNHWQGAAMQDAQGGAALVAVGAPKAGTLGDWDDDLLLGGLGNDKLEGGAGADVLDGGRGADRLTGGDGADEFRFMIKAFGKDVVTDFTDGLDHLSFARSVAASFSAFGVTGNDTAEVVLTLGAQVLTLQGAAPIHLDAADFVFV